MYQTLFGDRALSKVVKRYLANFEKCSWSSLEEKNLLKYRVQNLTEVLNGQIHIYNRNLFIKIASAISRCFGGKGWKLPLLSDISLKNVFKKVGPAITFITCHEMKKVTLDGFEITQEELNKLCQDHRDIWNLKIKHSDLSSLDIEAIGQLSRLKLLDLSFTHLGDSQVKALAAFKNLKGLNLLNLRFNSIGKVGAQALLASPALNHSDLWVNLRYNKIGKLTERMLRNKKNFIV